MTRDEFRESVFKRDNHKCVMCKIPATAAHHILERKLFPDGGYYSDNGASLCDNCHLEAELTTLSVECIRLACGVSDFWPPNFDASKSYDKWGNVILESGKREKGELFEDTGTQRALKAGRVLHLFKA